MRSRHIFVNGVLTDVTHWVRRPHVGPYLITDSMAPCVHPATGQVLDSKSAFREITRANGMVEMGNDAPRSAAPPPPDDAKADIAEAIQMLEQGYQPPPVETTDAWSDGGDFKVAAA